MSDSSGNTYGIVRAERGYFMTGRSATGVGAVQVFALQEGSGLNFPPKFLDVPGAANNVFDVSFYNGLYYPTARVAADVIGDWFTTAKLNTMFMTRGVTHGQPGFDDLSVITGGATYSDGNRAIGITGVKGDSLTLSSRQNDIVRCNMSFMGAASAESTWESLSPPLGQRASFANVHFLSGVSGVTDYQLSIMNMCQPNPIMGDGAGAAAVEINAGKPRYELALNVDARGTFPVMGTPVVFTITPPGGTAVTFTAALPRIDNPDELQRRNLRSGQNFNCLCMSSDGVGAGLVIS